MGLIKLKLNVGIKVKVSDIIKNFKKIKIIEFEVVILLRVLLDVDVVVININYVLEVKFVLIKDVLFIEIVNFLYVNVLVVCKGDEFRFELKELVKVLNFLEVKKFINKKY